MVERKTYEGMKRKETKKDEGGKQDTDKNCKGKKRHSVEQTVETEGETINKQEMQEKGYEQERKEQQRTDKLNEKREKRQNKQTKEETRSYELATVIMGVVENQLRGSSNKRDGWTQTNQTASEITIHASQQMMERMGSRGMESMDELDVAEAIQSGYTQVFNEEEGSTVASSNTSEYYELAAQVRQNFTEELNKWAKRETEQGQWDKYNKGVYIRKNNTKYEKKEEPQMRDTHMTPQTRLLKKKQNSEIEVPQLTIEDMVHMFGNMWYTEYPNMTKTVQEREDRWTAKQLIQTVYRGMWTNTIAEEQVRGIIGEIMREINEGERLNELWGTIRGERETRATARGKLYINKDANEKTGKAIEEMDKAMDKLWNAQRVDILFRELTGILERNQMTHNINITLGEKSQEEVMLETWAALKHQQKIWETEEEIDVPKRVRELEENGKKGETKRERQGEQHKRRLSREIEKVLGKHSATFEEIKSDHRGYVQERDRGFYRNSRRRMNDTPMLWTAEEMENRIRRTYLSTRRSEIEIEEGEGKTQKQHKHIPHRHSPKAMRKRNAKQKTCPYSTCAQEYRKCNTRRRRNKDTYSRRTRTR